jgi:SAM-dependent methyltransferase
MLTNNKEITTAGYWRKVYAGENNDAAVDASNTVRPPNPFDRFEWVAQHAEGPKVLDIGSGHAHICKRIKAKFPKWEVIASDQTIAAMRVARYQPYKIFSAYEIPFQDKYFQTIIATQCLEYMEFQEKFFDEAKRVASKLLITVPIGIMQRWSQLREYSEENVKELIRPYGNIEEFRRHDDLLLVKLKFYENII